MGKQDRRYIIIEAMGDMPESAPPPPPPRTARSMPPPPAFKRFGVEAAAVPTARAQPVKLDIQEHSLSEAQAAEGLGRGDLVNEVQVDEEQIRLSVGGEDPADVIGLIGHGLEYI